MSRQFFLHLACHDFTYEARRTRHLLLERRENLPGRAVVLMPIFTLYLKVLRKQCVEKMDKIILEFFRSGVKAAAARGTRGWWRGGFCRGIRYGLVGKRKELCFGHLVDEVI